MNSEHGMHYPGTKVTSTSTPHQPGVRLALDLVDEIHRLGLGTRDIPEPRVLDLQLGGEQVTHRGRVAAGQGLPVVVHDDEVDRVDDRHVGNLDWESQGPIARRSGIARERNGNMLLSCSVSTRNEEHWGNKIGLIHLVPSLDPTADRSTLIEWQSLECLIPTHTVKRTQMDVAEQPDPFEVDRGQLAAQS